MTRGRESRRRVRKKIRWGRVFILLLLCGIIGGLIFGAAQAYAWLRWRQEPAIPLEQRVDIWTERVNLLLLGYGPSVNQQQSLDAVVLVSFGRSGTVTLVPLPRELLVLREDGKPASLQEVFQRRGVLVARDAVAQWIQQPVHFYMGLSMESWMQFVDIGQGVEIYVEKDMNYEDGRDGTAIHLKRGVQRLDGKQTLDYLRYRSDDQGDVYRLQRQQRVARILGRQTISFAMLGRIGYYKAWFEQRVETDLPLRDAAILLWRGREMRTNGMHLALPPGELKRNPQGGASWTTPKEPLGRWLEENLPPL